MQGYLPKATIFLALTIVAFVTFRWNNDCSLAGDEQTIAFTEAPPTPTLTSDAYSISSEEGESLLGSNESVEEFLDATGDSPTTQALSMLATKQWSAYGPTCRPHLPLGELDCEPLFAEERPDSVIYDAKRWNAVETLSDEKISSMVTSRASDPTCNRLPNRFCDFIFLSNILIIWLKKIVGFVASIVSHQSHCRKRRPISQSPMC